MKSIKFLILATCLSMGACSVIDEPCTGTVVVTTIGEEC